MSSKRITLGGMKQTIHIWGTQEANPVVLFLHGGPGVSNRHGMAKHHKEIVNAIRRHNAETKV